MPRPSTAVVLAFGLTFALACNRPNWSDPVNAYLSFARAVQRSEWKLAWSALSEESKAALTERAKAVSQASGGAIAEEPAALFFSQGAGAPPVREVKLVKQEGKVAVVSVVPEEGPAREVRMVQENSGWKLDVASLLAD